MDRKVTVKNLSGGRVYYTIPNLNIKRKIQPQMAIELPFAEVQQGLYEYGIRTMFADGILGIVNEKDAIDLGLKVGQGVVENDSVTDDEIVKKLLGPNPQLAKFLREASVTVKENAGRLAVENRIVEVNKVKTIEQYTGVNVLNALKRENDLAAAPADAE